MLKLVLRTILLFLIINGCKTETIQKPFTLEASLTNIPDSTLFFLKDKSNITLDSGFVMNGKLSLRCEINSKHPKELLLFTISPEFIYTQILAKNDQISFQADKTDFPWNIDISGSEHQDAAEKFNQVEFIRQKLIDKALNDYRSDETLLSNRLETIEDSLDNEKVKLIRYNFNSYAALSRFHYHKTAFSSEELVSLFAQLGNDLKTTEMGKAVEMQSQYAMPEVGDAFYDYTAVNQFGDSVSISSFSGKYILLHFASMACKGSQLAMPELKSFHQNNQNQLAVISISTDPNRELWIKHSESDSINWNYLWDGKGNYSDAYVKYWEVGTPNFVLISPDGIILERWTGYGEGLFDEKVIRYLN